MKRVLRAFDKLEDRIRSGLSKQPLLYALIGGVGIVLFWRGVWGIADSLPYLSDPVVSLLVSLVLLLSVGLFVSFFIGDSILLSGIRGEKKLIEKTETDIRKEGQILGTLESEVKEEVKILGEIKEELKEQRREVEAIKQSLK